MKILNARALKCTIVLDPAEIGGLQVPTTARVTLRISAGGRTYTADVATKSLRKAQASIAGADCAVFIQGKLVGDAITEAGLVAQAKVAPAA